MAPRIVSLSDVAALGACDKGMAKALSVLGDRDLPIDVLNRMAKGLLTASGLRKAREGFNLEGRSPYERDLAPINSTGEPPLLEALDAADNLSPEDTPFNTDGSGGTFSRKNK